METSLTVVSSSTWVTRVMDRRPGIDSAPHLAAVQQDMSVFFHIHLCFFCNLNANIYGRFTNDEHKMDATVPEKVMKQSKAKKHAAAQRNPIVNDIESCSTHGRVHYMKLVQFLRSLQASLQCRGVGMYTTGVICFARSYFIAVYSVLLRQIFN